MGLSAPAVGQLWGQAWCRSAVSSVEGGSASWRRRLCRDRGARGTRSPLEPRPLSGRERGAGLGGGRSRDPSWDLDRNCFSQRCKRTESQRAANPPQPKQARRREAPPSPQSTARGVGDPAGEGRPASEISGRDPPSLPKHDQFGSPVPCRFGWHPAGSPGSHSFKPSASSPDLDFPSVPKVAAACSSQRPPKNPAVADPERVTVRPRSPPGARLRVSAAIGPAASRTLRGAGGRSASSGAKGKAPRRSGNSLRHPHGSNAPVRTPVKPFPLRRAAQDGSAGPSEPPCPLAEPQPGSRVPQRQQEASRRAWERACG